jgi:hypothetical protein
MIAFSALAMGTVAQIQKCGFSCHPYDRSDYTNILYGMRVTSNNVMECEYGSAPVHVCRYDAVSANLHVASDEVAICSRAPT